MYFAMDNYGNVMYLSPPSIDFKLLDRSSGNKVLAHKPVPASQQGDASFLSLNPLDGTEAASYNNQSFSDHGSYVVEAHKNAMWRHTSGEFVSFPNYQSKGVHDFFEQGSQLEHAAPSLWPRNQQSAYVLHRAASEDERVQIPLYRKASFQYDDSEHANEEARMPHASVGVLNSMMGEALDCSNLVKVSMSVEKGSRNQASTSNGVLNFPPSNSFGCTNPAPVQSGMSSHHPTPENSSFLYQNQVENYDVSSQTKGVFNYAPSYNFIGVQVPRKGAMQHPQAVASKHPQGLTRPIGPSELQSRQQLQELFLVQQLKQMEDSRQEDVSQKVSNHFSMTSYYDLLHGPDTPPPQQQTDDFGNHASVLPSEHAESARLFVDGSFYHQGVVNEYMDQIPNSASQLSSHREPVDLDSHLQSFKDQNGPPVAPYIVGQAAPEHIDGRWKSASSHQSGRPVLEAFHLGGQHQSDTPTTDFGLANDWNNDSMKTSQPLAKLNAISGELTVKQKTGGLFRVNALSQSQQHFQELQFGKQKNPLVERKQPVSSPQVSFSSLSVNPAESTLKNGMQHCSNSFTTRDNFVGSMPQNLFGIPLDSVAATAQPPWLTKSSRPSTAEAGGRQQATSWEGLQPAQSSRGIDFNLESAAETRYNASGNNNSQHLAQQGSLMLGSRASPFEAFDMRQQGLYNTQVISRNAKASFAGSGPVSNHKICMSLHDCQNDVGGTNVSNVSAQPLAEPASHFQGAWKKYTPTMELLPAGGSLGQEGLHHQHGFQDQYYSDSEASFHPSATPIINISTSTPFVSSQLVHTEKLPGKYRQHLEKPISQDLPTLNLKKTVSRHALKVVPDAIESDQGRLYKPVEAQDVLNERQQEVPQQQVNFCPTNISLAHLRGGHHSSSSLSPQHFRLGLGPSYDAQHPIDASWKNFPNLQSLSGEVPNLKSAQKTSSTESPRRRASSDTSSTSSFVSGHIKGCTSLVSASTNSYSNECYKGCEPTRIRDNAREDTLSVFRVQTSASNCASHQVAMNGYISSYSKPLDHSAGAAPLQKKLIIDTSTQLDKDGSHMHAIQDRNVSNISLRQVGNSPIALDSRSLAVVSKASALEHPKSIGSNKQQTSWILEPSRMPSSSLRGVIDGDQRRETMQRDLIMSRNSNNLRHEEHLIQVSNMQYTFNDELNSVRVTQFGNEVTGSMPSTPSLNTQVEMQHSGDDDSSQSMQAWRPIQSSNRYPHAKFMDSYPAETKADRGNMRKPPLRAPSSAVMSPSMQPPTLHEDSQQRQNFLGSELSTRVERSLIHEDSQQRQSLLGSELSARVERSPESAKPPLPMHTVMWSAKQRAGNAQSLAVIENSISRFDASVSENESHNNSQPVGTSEYSQVQMGKFHQIVPNLASLASSEFKHTNVLPSEKPPIVPHQSAGNSKEYQVITCDNQVPLGSYSSTIKEEVSVSKNESQLSPLKASTLGEVAPLSKKRKKHPPLLIPWHITVAQPSTDLPSNSDAEMVWSNALNRALEKDFNATHEETTSNVFRAKRRLILTTGAMQRLFPPLLDELMHGTTPAERECGIYSLAKCALEDACRLVAKNEDQARHAETSASTTNSSFQGQVGGVAKDRKLMQCAEHFMERVKNLGMELARLDYSTSVLELQDGTHDLEKLSIVNRLAEHHGIKFTMDSSDTLFTENIFEFGVGARKPLPQRYVTAAPMPRMLPDGIRCLSL